MGAGGLLLIIGSRTLKLREVFRPEAEMNKKPSRCSETDGQREMKDTEKLSWRHDRCREAWQEIGPVHGNPGAQTVLSLGLLQWTQSPVTNSAYAGCI